MNRPVMLETFACEGGATAGYQRAGFEVWAVDSDPNRLKYNPAEHKLMADAFTVLDAIACGNAVRFDDGAILSPADVDASHQSPPCQFYSRGNAGKVTTWPRLIPDCREAAIALGVPYVIENVVDAGYDMEEPTLLCGCMFDLSTIDTDGIRIHLQRPRLFEVGGFDLAAPRSCDHSAHEWVAGAYGGARRDKYEAKYVRKGGYVPPEKHIVAALLGAQHPMTWRGLFESLPPAYTEHIGAQLIAHLEQEVAA